MTRFLAACREYSKYSDGWALRLRRRSAALRAEPATLSHRLRAAATNAGTGLLILFLTILLPMIFAGA